MTINDDLYRLSPVYRRLVDDYIVLQRDHGALQAAYRNALGDQRHLRVRLEKHEPVVRDDPGRGGSSGHGNAHS